MINEQTTCALVATCGFNVEHFTGLWEKGLFDHIVAVDRGFMHLELVGCAPDYVLGDFDSLGYVPEGANVEAHPTHKDESDLELALNYAQRKGFAAVVIYGALGGRVDHTLAALQVGARFAEQGMQITFIGLESAVRVLVGPDSFDFPDCEAGTVSVFSACEECSGVSEWGLEYPLDNARLSNRTTLGLSNELLGQPAGVRVDQGTLYVFYPA